MQVREDSLGDALDEVVVEAQGVDADQQGDSLPGDLHQVVVAQVQVLERLQEVLRRESRALKHSFPQREGKESKGNLQNMLIACLLMEAESSDKGKG